MGHWEQELALVEAAALRIEQIEVRALAAFERAREQAGAGNAPGRVEDSPELRAWMAARADTDAAWGRWAQVMDARPAT